MDKSLNHIFLCFGEEFYNSIKKINADINEIRIRTEKPVVVYIRGEPFLLQTNGNLTPMNSFNEKTIYTTVSFSALRKAFERLCDYSVYKHQNDINNGFITVHGGHRIGICGTVVDNSADIRNVTDITSLNIRIARDYIGCSNEILNRVNFSSGVLICGVPSSGKTTLLRDLSRNLSLRLCKKAAVIDERSEIASCFNGRSMFDLGFCDIYSGFKKAHGVVQAIRTMSPDYIICDELTGNDIESVVCTVNYGVKLIAAVHCDCLENALKNPSIVSLIRTGAFGTVVFLKSNDFCEIEKIVCREDIGLD